MLPRAPGWDTAGMAENAPTERQRQFMQRTVEEWQEHLASAGMYDVRVVMTLFGLLMEDCVREQVEIEQATNTYKGEPVRAAAAKAETRPVIEDLVCEDLVVDKTQAALRGKYDARTISRHDLPVDDDDVDSAPKPRRKSNSRAAKAGH